MTTNELMLGDWVSYKGKMPCKITAICKDTAVVDNDSAQEWMIDYDKLTPITLTPEILEKNGFKKELSEDNNHYRFILIYDGIKFSLLYARSVFQWLGPLDFKYVHELQRALKLCGIKKEIDL